jgi:hypothetical protein
MSILAEKSTTPQVYIHTSFIERLVGAASASMVTATTSQRLGWALGQARETLQIETIIVSGS